MAEEIVNNESVEEVDNTPVNDINEDAQIAEDDAYMRDLEALAKEMENDEDSIEDENITDVNDETFEKVNLDDAFYAASDDLFANINTAYLNSKTSYWEKEGKKFEEKFGDKAKEEFDKAYLEKDKLYQEALQQKQDSVILAHGMTNVLYEDDDIYEGGESEVKAVVPTLTGARQMGDVTSRDQVSRRQAMVKTGKFVDDQGEVRKLEKDEDFLTFWDSDDEKDITFNEDYNSKDGRSLVGFEYGNDNYLHALYEGDIPKNEIMSVWDTSDFWASNALDSKWTELPKCVVRSGVNLVADAMIGLVELGNSMNVLMGDKSDVDYTRTQATVLNRYKLSKSDYDQEHLFTLSNGLDFVVNTYLQLVLAGGVGKIAAKGAGMLAGATGASSALMASAEAAMAAGDKAKYLLMTKRAQQLVSLPSKAASLGIMSLLAGTGIKDEARRAGFSEKAIAGMYLAYLPAMAAASHTSGLLESASSMKANERIINGAIKESLAFTTPTAASTSKGALKWAHNAAKKVVGTIQKHAGKEGVWDKGLKGYLHASVNEGREEVIEQIYEEGLKQISSAVSLIASDKPKPPRFKTVTDDGYITEQLQEAIMNFTGGALGGAMAKASMAGPAENELPFQSTDRDALLKVAASKEPTQKLFLDTLEKSYKAGLLGSHDLLLEVDKTTKLHKKVSDLPESEQADALTIAKANKRAILFQYNKYKSYLGGTEASIDQLEQTYPELYKELVDNDTVFDVAKSTYNEIAEFYDSLSDIDPSSVKQSVDIILDESTSISSVSNKKRKSKPDAPKEAKQDETEKEVAGDEEGVTEELATEEDTEDVDVLVSDDVLRLAKETNLTLTQAQNILNKEQKMRDIMSGKYLEKAYIADMITKNPELSILNGTDPDKLYANLGNDFIDALHKGDVNALKIANDKAKAKAAKLTSNNELISKMTSDPLAFEDIKKQLLGDDTGDFYLSQESLVDLQEQLTNHYNELLNSDETKAAALDYYSKLFEGSSLLEGDDKIDKLTEELEYSTEDGPETLYLTVDSLDDGSLTDYAEQQGVTFGDDGDFDNETQYLYYLLAKANESILKPHFKALGSQAVNNAAESGALTNEMLERVSTVEDYDTMVTKIASNITEDAVEDFTMGFVDFTTDEYSNMFASEANGMKKLSEYEAPTQEITKEFETVKAAIADKAVTNIPPVYSNDTTAFFGNVFTVRENSVETGEKSIGDSVAELIDSNLESLSGRSMSEIDALDPNDEDLVFKGAKEAKQLMDQVQTRKAQLLLLQQSMTSLGSFRIRNSNILADRDVRLLFDKNAYDNYSKYVSSYVFDPVKFFDLQNKSKEGTLTEEEKQLNEKMERRFNSLFGEGSVLEDIVRAEGILNQLIEIGDSSKTAARLSKAYKTEVAESAKDVGNQLRILVETTPELLQIEELADALRQLDELEPSKAKPDQIIKANSLVKVVANTLYAWKEQNPEKGKNLLATLASNQYNMGLINSNTTTSMSDIACFLSIPYEQFLADYKFTLNRLLEKDTNMNIPTAVQQRVAMHVYTMGLAKLPKTSSTMPSSNNIIWTEGLYGTGKTTVVAGYGISSLQNSFEARYPGHSDAMFCANNEKQASKLAEIVESDFSIKHKKGPANGGFTKDNLIEIVESEDAFDQLASTSFIVYDEATQIEFDPSNKESEMMRILAGLENVNVQRIKEGLPEIKLVLMGDTMQGGFLEGMSTDMSPTAKVQYPTSGKPVNIGTHIYGLFKAPKLTYQFRSAITQLETVAATLNRAAKMARSTEPLRIDETITTGHGEIMNIPGNYKGGIEVVQSPSQLFSDDLVQDLESKLAADPKFKAVIVDNSLGDVNNVQHADIKRLLLKYPKQFSIQTTTSVQGDEVDYVIANFGDRLIPSMNTVNSDTRFAYNIASMVIGRATKYVKGYFGKNLKIKSTQQPIVGLTKDNEESIKAEWKEFNMNGLLNDVDTSNITITATTSEDGDTPVERVIPPELKFTTGEVVYRQATPEARPIKYTVKQADGDVVIFTDRLGNDVAFNYNTDLGTIEEFKKSTNGGRDLTTDIPIEAVNYFYSNKMEAGVTVTSGDFIYTVKNVTPNTGTDIPGDTLYELENDTTKEVIVIGDNELQTRYIVDAFEKPSEELLEEYEAAEDKTSITLEERSNMTDLSAFKSGVFVKSKADGKIYTIYGIKTEAIEGERGRIVTLKVRDIDTKESTEFLPTDVDIIKPPTKTPKKKAPVVEKKPALTDDSLSSTVTSTAKDGLSAMDNIKFVVGDEELTMTEVEKKVEEHNKRIEKHIRDNTSIPLDVLKERAELQEALSLGDDSIKMLDGNTTSNDVINSTLQSLKDSFDTQINDDNTDAREYMKALEEQGIGVFYTNRENEYNTRELDSVTESDKKSYYAAAELYGFAKNTASPEAIAKQVAELRPKALPLYEKNKQLQKQSMSRFKYYFNTYEYMYDGQMVVGHALMAIHKGTDATPILLGLIPTNSLEPDSKISKIIRNKTKFLEEAVNKYVNEDTLVEGVKEGKTGSIWKDTKKKLQPRRRQAKKTNLFVETPITSLEDVLSLFKQPTIGSLVTNSKKTLEQFEQVLEATGEDLAVNTYETRAITSAESLKKAMSEVGKSKRITKDMILNSNLFGEFGKDKVITEVATSRGKLPVVAIKTRNEQYIPFYRDDKHGFIPFFGIDNNGEFIEDGEVLTDFLGGKGNLYNDEYTAIKDVLDKSFPRGFKTFKTISTKVDNKDLIPIFGKMLGYDPKVVTKGVKRGNALLEATSSKALGLAVKSWANISIPIRTFDAMMEQFGRTRSGLKMSPLMVFRSTDEQYRGKLFRLYTYNPDYNLEDDSDLEKIKSKLSAALKNGELNESLLSREGIGIMEVNSEYSSFSDVYSYYESGVARDTMNKLVMPSKSEASFRLANMFIELLDMYNISKVDTEFSRIKDHKNLFSNDGNLQSILTKDEVLRNQLKSYLTAASNDPVFKQAQEALKKLVLKMTTNDSLGHLLIKPEAEITAVEYKHSDGINGKIVLNKDTRQPAVFNNNPLTVFHSSMLNEAISSGNLEAEGIQMSNTVRVDLHTLMAQIAEIAPDSKVRKTLLSIVDQIMTRYTKPGTLSKGLNISPSVAGQIGIGDIWSKVDTSTVDASGRNAVDRCTVRVKDIKQPNVLFNIDALENVLNKTTETKITFKSGEDIMPNVLEAIEKFRMDAGALLISSKRNKTDLLSRAYNNASAIINAHMKSLHPKDYLAKTLFQDMIRNEHIDAMTQLSKSQLVSSSDTMEKVFDSIDSLVSRSLHTSPSVVKDRLASKYLQGLDAGGVNNELESTESKIRDYQKRILKALLGSNTMDISNALGVVAESAQSILPIEGINQLNNVRTLMHSPNIQVDNNYLNNWLSMAEAHNVNLGVEAHYSIDDVLNNYMNIADKASLVESAFTHILNKDVDPAVRQEIRDHLFGEGELLKFMDIKEQFVDFLRNNHNKSIESSAAYNQLLDMGITLEDIPSLQSELDARFEAGGLMLNGESKDAFIADIYKRLDAIKSDSTLLKEEKINIMTELKNLVSERLAQNPEVLGTIDKAINDLSAPTETKHEVRDLLLSKFSGKLSPEASATLLSMSEDLEAYAPSETHVTLSKLFAGELSDVELNDFMYSSFRDFIMKVKNDKGIDIARSYQKLLINDIAEEVDNKKGCNTKM